MKRRLLIYLICFAAFIQTISVWVVDAESRSVHLVILHVNDTHGRLSPYDTEEAKSVGGIARMATRIKEIREANKGRTLVLHAGDALSRGDLLTVYYGGEVNMLAMEAAGYDAFIPGNGDLYFGVENLMRQTARVKFPILLANVVYRENGKRLFQPYMIKEMAGVKIAILGLGFIRENHPSGWHLGLQDPVAVAKAFLPLLRSEADLVVALTHIGLEADKRLAAEVPQIDIIVGGHSHSRLDAPLRIPRSEREGEVIIAQAGDYRRFLGRLDVYLESDESGEFRVSDVKGELLPIDGRIEEDEGIARLLEWYSDPLSKVICTSEATLTNPETGDSPLGNFVVEAIRVSMNADVALLARGSVQGEIAQGEVTIADVYQIHPWRNRVLELTLTGAELQNLLTKQEILFSGVTHEDPIEPDRTYRIAAGHFVLTLDPALREVSSRETCKRVDTVLLEYLKQIQVIEEAAHSVISR